MSESLRAAQPWLTFIGCVLVVAVLSLAQAIVVPIALATLLAFLLTPVVATLQRRVGRVPAVLAVVMVTFALAGAAGWVVTQQLAGLASEMPAYRQNIRQKIRDVRGAGKGGSVEALQKTVADIEAQLEAPSTESAAVPPTVRPAVAGDGWSFPTIIGPLLGRLSTAALVVVLVVFMLLEREDLRNRVMRLFGHGRLVVTTKAFDEAGRRVSRYLLVQSLVNLFFGIGIGIGLFFIGVPYPILWGALAGGLRFIPYVGPVIGALAPLLTALAALEGWTRPFLVLGLFVALELLVNLALETVLYAGAIGVSQVALLVAVAFWSWLWGPLGLLLATPLTVCLVVLGKYVPGLEFVSTMISDEPVLANDLTYYQRLLAGDQAEASELLERHLATEDPATVYDAIMLPALGYAERDRLEDRLSPAEELAVVAATRELLTEIPIPTGALRGDAPASIPVLALAAEGPADVVALQMLAQLLVATPFTLDVREHTMRSVEMIEALELGHYRAVCIADLPPSPPLRSRYLVKRLRTAAPAVPIVVGRWAPAALADESDDRLRAAGATAVAASLQETREQLADLLAVPASEGSTHAA